MNTFPPSLSIIDTFESLTHLPLNKMADDAFGCIFVNEKFCILIQISLNFIPKGPIDNNPALV